MTDQELIERFLQGEINSFNTLVWRWQKPLFNFIYRYIGDMEDAKDVCQKTFIRAYKNLHRLKNTAKFSSWLYQIAVNLCRDELRAKKRNPVVSLTGYEKNNTAIKTSPLDSLSDEATRPDKALTQRELEEILRQALMSIPEEQRVVIVMKEYQGLKFTEIAETLEVPLNTVKSRMYYGLSALKKALLSLNIDEEAIKYEM